jgi:MYXO-CTERM domain-containing protein
LSNRPGADGASGTAPENDEIIVGGTFSLTLGGTLTVQNIGVASWSLGDRWDLFDWVKAPTGTFTTVTLPALPAGMAWNTSDLYVGGTISTVVPEPSAAVLLALFAGPALMRRRRS